MISDVVFTRRVNYDSTVDSICLTCYLTVARGTEATVGQAEQEHDCERSIKAECDRARRYEISQQGTF
jgi:hypothetical protein